TEILKALTRTIRTEWKCEKTPGPPEFYTILIGFSDKTHRPVFGVHFVCEGVVQAGDAACRYRTPRIQLFAARFRNRNWTAAVDYRCNEA
ncbi:MAG: hypothetical protein V2B18_20295, partial [Pseudomonadota bacterium]